MAQKQLRAQELQRRSISWQTAYAQRWLKAIRRRCEGKILYGTKSIAGSFMIRNSWRFLIVCSLILFLVSCSKSSPPAVQTASSAQPSFMPTDPATAASISGVVRFEGAAPAAQKIDMSADSGCKGQNQSENAIVNNGHLANVLVYVKDGLDG